MEFEKLQEIIADVLNVDPNEVTMETTFADDLGADSLDVFQIVMGIEEEFDIQITSYRLRMRWKRSKRNWQNNRKWRRGCLLQDSPFVTVRRTPANGNYEEGQA